MPQLFRQAGYFTARIGKIFHGSDEDQPDGQFAAEAIRLLRSNRDRPFFIGLGFHKPHDPFVAPKKYFDMYPLEKLELVSEPADASPLHPQAIGSAWKESFDKFTDRERREFMRAYYAGTSFADAQFGKVLDAMQRFDLLDNTIIVFLADNGYQLGNHGWWNKNTLYEQSTRVPLLVTVPGLHDQ
jgi:arylsulfatase A-like enzyme